MDLAIKERRKQGHAVGLGSFVIGRSLLAHGGTGIYSIALFSAAESPSLRSTRNQIKEGADLIKICLSGGLGLRRGFTTSR